MGQKISDVWYSSEKRTRNSFKLYVYDDLGTLEIEPGQITFTGHKQTLRIRDVRHISLVRQAWNWKMYALVNIVLLPVYFLLYWFLNPIIKIEATTIIVAVIIMNFLGLLVGFSTRWVKIEHGGSADSFYHSYFADGSDKGWRGVFGGTKKLYKLLTHAFGLSG